MSSLRLLIAAALLASTVGLAACEGLNNAHLGVERSRPDGP